jgi:hypothetical protein
MNLIISIKTKNRRLLSAAVSGKEKTKNRRPWKWPTVSTYAI